MNEDHLDKEWLVIVNPNAGRGTGKKDWAKISRMLENESIRFVVRFTGKKWEAADFARENINAGFRNIITVGGDGTLNEVLNGVFTNDTCSSKEVTLALIPVGTGNDWGKMFGIPPDYKEAIKIISRGKIMVHDTGLIKYFDGTEEKTRYFINIAGLGFESAVVKRTNIQKDKGRSGKAIYFYNLVASLFSYHNTPAELIIDGVTHNAKVFSVNVGNGRYCGGGMRQTPDALPDDGLLDVTVINGIGKLEIIRNLKLLYNGKILSHPKIDGYKCKNLKISSGKLLYAEADGESLGHTPAEFSVLPGSINIVYDTYLIR
jgi:diacylglycerol kinase (ATP)